jgi:hypothetical protein
MASNTAGKYGNEDVEAHRIAGGMLCCGSIWFFVACPLVLFAIATLREKR